MTEPTSEQGRHDDDARFDELLERSSLGTAGARQLRRRVPPAEAEFIGRLADTLEVLRRPRETPTEEPAQAEISGIAADRDDHEVTALVREHLIQALNLLTDSSHIHSPGAKGTEQADTRTKPGSPQLEGQNCTVVLTDVIAFGARSRSDEDRRAIREVLYNLMQTVLPAPLARLEDRGDGFLAVIPPAVPTAKVIQQLLEDLPAALDLYNSTVRESARFQLRVAVDVGPVFSDAMGVSGEATITLYRLVEAPAFKSALAAVEASLGIIASQFIYDTVIRHSYEGIDPAPFALVQVNVKESSFPAWMQIISDQTRDRGHYEVPPDEVEESAGRRWQPTPRPEPGNELFTVEAETEPVSAEEIGYRGPTACAAADITYRQLNYWSRTGLVEPSMHAAHGSGSHRLYSFRDILMLKMVKRLLDTGISLQQIRAAVQHLRDRGSADLTQVTLMSDGYSVYECTSPDEVVHLLQGGQGVFGIALGRLWREVEGDLAVPSAGRAGRPGVRGGRRAAVQGHPA